MEICEDSSASTSQTEGDEEMEGRREEEDTNGSAPTLSSYSSTLLSVMRIKKKYQAMKRRRLELFPGATGTPAGAPTRTSPKIFTFDSTQPYLLSPSVPQRKKKKRRKRRRVMFPNGGGRRASPKPGRSRAKYCLYLLVAILFMQVYNAIENLDDHVLMYDLDGLEKTLRREVFGQPGAVGGLLSHLRDYLSTYVHVKPLVVALHGPSGVGKSHMGRLLAAHYRSVVGEALVRQHYVLHHCPLEADAVHCARNLSALISETVERAEVEEKIPLFIFDEVEHMHAEMLDTLWRLVGSKQSNEYLKAIYLFLSNVGHAHITKHVLHNSSRLSASAAGDHGGLGQELTPVLRGALEKLHPLWAEAEIVPLGLLERGHVMECFLDEMTREGFYPDHANVERLAGQIEYYPEVGGRRYAQTGCKQVVAKVNLL